jgi:hypothetical protein
MRNIPLDLATGISLVPLFINRWSASCALNPGFIPCCLLGKMEGQDGLFDRNEE